MLDKELLVMLGAFEVTMMIVSTHFLNDTNALIGILISMIIGLCGIVYIISDIKKRR